MASLSFQNLPEVFGKYRWRWYPRKYFGFDYFLISQKLSRPRQVGQGGPVALSPWPPPSHWHPLPAIPVLQFLSQFDQLDHKYILMYLSISWSPLGLSNIFCGSMWLMHLFLWPHHSVCIFMHQRLNCTAGGKKTTFLAISNSLHLMWVTTTLVVLICQTLNAKDVPPAFAVNIGRVSKIKSRGKPCGSLTEVRQGVSAASDEETSKSDRTKKRKVKRIFREVKALW